MDPIKDIRGLAAKGELLSAIDLAREQADLAQDDELRDLIRVEEVILLARIASSEEAREKFYEYHLDEALASGARSLNARLRKDLGFAADNAADKARLLRESRDEYLTIAKGHDPASEWGEYEYNGINAVSLSREIDDMAAVADVVEALSGPEPQDNYWSWATRAELLIATGAPADEARAALATAMAQADAGLSAQASTLKQLTRVAPDHPALAALRPGPVLHFSGHMIAAPGADFGRVLAVNEPALTERVNAALTEIDPSVVYGSLASGVDILVVEWALAAGRPAVVFLPFREAAFFALSVAPAGAQWVARARACLDHDLTQLRFLTRDDATGDDAHAFAAVAHLAMGSAILHADNINANAVQLVVWDGEDSGGVAGAAADRRVWQASEHEQVEVDVADLGARAPASSRQPQGPIADPPRQAAALVFGDVKNFSKLNERQLPTFVSEVMGAVAKALDDTSAQYGDDCASFVNTWGDGVFAVFASPSPAAFFARRLQDRMTALPLSDLGLPKDLAIRLGMHFGVVYRQIEPVTAERNYFGEAVARAARIEPITTEGRVFVSEEFAAELALDPNAPASTEYVGERDTAKKYGRFRLYRLR
ncbi:MAG: adenylate/guanylate cyclase domain-containing protein [Pikeienuella sp.]